MEFILITVAVGFAVFLFIALRSAASTYRELRGDHLITCPENHKSAAVRIAAGKAAVEATIGKDYLRLSNCSRWPEKKGCGQECLAQIADSPKSCLVSTIINHWYEGNSCVYCHKPFGQIHWHDHPPALVDSELKSVQWNDVPLDKLQETLNNHWPVCWDCHIAETFRREHPDLVVDRSVSPLRQSVWH